MPDTFDPSGANNLNAIRDRITKTLADATREMTPIETFREIGRAAAKAATSDVSYGDAMNAQKAERMGVANQMMSFLNQDRQLEIQEQQARATRQKNAIEEWKAVSQAVKDHVPEEQRALYFRKLQEMPENVDRRNVLKYIGVIQKQLQESGELKAAGPLEGTALDAQLMNILLAGDPASAEYHAAYNRLGQQRQVFNPQTGQHVTISPNMGAYRLPVGSPAQEQIAGTGTGAPGLNVQQVTPPILTKEEKDAAGFTTRLEASDTVISRYEGVGASPFGTVAESDYYPNLLKSSERQQLEQAERDFVNAVLRRESGAVISPEEFDNANKQYFPQPGDGPDVIAQKKAARQRAIEAMRFGAGRAAQPPGAGATSTTDPTTQWEAVNPETGQVLVYRNGEWVPKQ